MPTLLEEGVVLAGRHRLDRFLGEGGMGVVWAATNTLTGMPVAVKLVKASEGDTAARKSEARLRERFLREARAACAVRHPNVVQIYDIAELEDGVPMIVMELLSGESLKGRLRRAGPLGVRETAEILVPVLSAVGVAHSLGIVHRDLKPDNIFLADDERHGRRVKVLDFGLAKQTAIETDVEAPGLTTTGVMLGTPYYMAPEQVFGDSDIDHRADVWALGVVIYECLTGSRPMQGDSVGQVLKMITTGAIPPVASKAPAVPAELASMVDRMLSRERDERPLVAEVFAALRAQLGGDSSAEPVPAPPPPMTSRRNSAPGAGDTLSTMHPPGSAEMGSDAGGASGREVVRPRKAPNRTAAKPSRVSFGSAETQAHRDDRRDGDAHDRSASAISAFAASAPKPSQARGWIAGTVLLVIGLGSWWALRSGADTSPNADGTSSAASPTSPDAPPPPSMTTPPPEVQAPAPYAPQPASAVAETSPPPPASAAGQARRPHRPSAPRGVALAPAAAPEAPPPPAVTAPPKPTGTLQGAVVEKPPF